MDAGDIPTGRGDRLGSVLRLNARHKGRSGVYKVLCQLESLFNYMQIIDQRKTL